MALETATYISDLVSTNPEAGDNVSQGDDHLRLLKSTIKATFPNVSGAVTATHAELNILDGVTATTAELNYVDGVTSNIQTQIDAVKTTVPAVTGYSASTAPGSCVVVTAGFTLATGLAAGTVFSVYNNSTGTITITQGSGLTLRLAGTSSTGNRTLAARGLATVWVNSTTEYILSGAGVA